MTDEFFEMFMGRTELDTQWQPEGRDLVGMGRMRRFNQHGVLIDDSGWQPTGVRLIAPHEDARHWWKFW